MTTTRRMLPDPSSARGGALRLALTWLCAAVALGAGGAHQPASAQSGGDPAGSVERTDAADRLPVLPLPGEEVRVVQRGARGAVHGRYVDTVEGQLVLSGVVGGGPIRIPMDDITGIAVQRGQRSRGLSGAFLGLGLGVAAGVALGQSGDVFDDTVTAVGVSAGIGLPLGLVVGLLIRSPEWDGVDLPALRNQGSAGLNPSSARPARYRPAPGR